MELPGLLGLSKRNRLGNIQLSNLPEASACARLRCNKLNEPHYTSTRATRRLDPHRLDAEWPFHGPIPDYRGLLFRS